jgi:hypothetical protein
MEGPVWRLAAGGWRRGPAAAEVAAAAAAGAGGGRTSADAAVAVVSAAVWAAGPRCVVAHGGWGSRVHHQAPDDPGDFVYHYCLCIPSFGMGPGRCYCRWLRACDCGLHFHQCTVMSSLPACCMLPGKPRRHAIRACNRTIQQLGSKGGGGATSSTQAALLGCDGSVPPGGPTSRATAVASFNSGSPRSRRRHSGARAKAAGAQATPLHNAWPHPPAAHRSGVSGRRRLVQQLPGAGCAAAAHHAGPWHTAGWNGAAGSRTPRFPGGAAPGRPAGVRTGLRGCCGWAARAGAAGQAAVATPRHRAEV